MICADVGQLIRRRSNLGEEKIFSKALIMGLESRPLQKIFSVEVEQRVEVRIWRWKDVRVSSLSIEARGRLSLEV